MIGANTPSVVPGYVVDSSTTVVPGVTSVPRVSAAASTNERSGRPSRIGVGTVTIATSNPPHSAGSVVTWYRPLARPAATTDGATSSTYESPSARRLARPSSTSSPTTSWPT